MVITIEFSDALSIFVSGPNLIFSCHIYFLLRCRHSRGKKCSASFLIFIAAFVSYGWRIIMRKKICENSDCPIWLADKHFAISSPDILPFTVLPLGIYILKQLISFHSFHNSHFKKFKLCTFKSIQSDESCCFLACLFKGSDLFLHANWVSVMCYGKLWCCMKLY